MKIISIYRKDTLKILSTIGCVTLVLPSTKKTLHCPERHLGGGVPGPLGCTRDHLGLGSPTAASEALGVIPGTRGERRGFKDKLSRIKLLKGLGENSYNTNTYKERL